MTAWLGPLAAPASLGARRIRVRPFGALVLAAAVGAAAGLIGWSSLVAALSQEDNVGLRLRSLPIEQRSLQVVYFTLPGEADFRAPTVADAFHSVGVTGAAHRLRIWHSLEPRDPLGTRVAVVANRADVEVTAGRRPRGCRGNVCEALALGGRLRVGDRVRLGGGLSALVVGRGSVLGALPGARSELGRRPLLVRSLTKRLEAVVDPHGSTVVAAAPLDPDRVHGFDARAIAERLRRTIGRLELGDPLVRASAPVTLLQELADRGDVARGRLRLVAAEGAALLLAFGVFVAVARRRETETLETTLETLGASRLQVWSARAMDALVPALVGTVAALAGVVAAAFVVAGRRGLPHGFVSAALPGETIAAMVAAGLAAAILLTVAGSDWRVSRRGFGPLELAALAAFGILVWQAAATGALDPQRVSAHGGDPILPLLPGLAFFAAAVLLLRGLPPALRLAERGARHGPDALRLALLTAARSPAQAAAATTFLAVTVGASLFSLAYRDTLDRQAGDQARFVAGAEWRVSHRVQNRLATAAPLTAFAGVSPEAPTPALRLEGSVFQAAPEGGLLPVQVVGLPAASLGRVLGWRDSFSGLSRDEIARRLRPRPVRLAGIRLGGDASAIRVWARSQTDYPRVVVLHLLLRGQAFADVSLGIVFRKWQLLRTRLQPSTRGAQLIGIDFMPTYVPISFKYDPKGFVELGPIQVRRAAGWASLPSVGDWAESVEPDATAGVLSSARFAGAPVTHGIRFDLNGTFQPLIHPSFGLPAPLPGFVTGAVPAVVSEPVAAEQVDRLLTLQVAGKQVPLRVVGTARLFPTVVARPDSFVLVDYDTLFATLNADQPGLAPPSEAWFFRPPPPRLGQALARARFHEPRVVRLDALTVAARSDPLAAGTRRVLGVAAVVAAALALVGLVLGTRSALLSERVVSAEYEALGLSPRALSRSAQIRTIALAALGLVAALAGALLGVRLIAAGVAVTGTARTPLPPIVTSIPWAIVVAVVAAVAVAAVAIAAVLTGRTLREAPGRRLRA